MPKPLNRREILRFRQYVKGLREMCPLDLPVSVRKLKRPKAWGHGDSTHDGQRYYIRLRADQGYVAMCDTLCHEWAHCMAWDDGASHQHDDAWGIAYAKCYRAMLAISSDWPHLDDDSLVQ